MPTSAERLAIIERVREKFYEVLRISLELNKDNITKNESEENGSKWRYTYEDDDNKMAFRLTSTTLDEPNIERANWGCEFAQFEEIREGMR